MKLCKLAYKTRQRPNLQPSATDYNRARLLKKTSIFKTLERLQLLQPSFTIKKVKIEKLENTYTSLFLSNLKKCYKKSWLRRL
uniref:Uncharacterized protein n=1 Tax=Dulem virus 37 TaxID=3145755 RepID=A0AAU8AWG6_9CAUD